MESKDSVQKRNSLVWGGAKETKVDGTVCKMLQKKEKARPALPKVVVVRVKGDPWQTLQQPSVAVCTSSPSIKTQDNLGKSFHPSDH